MLNISWNGSTSEVPGTIAVGSGDPKTLQHLEGYCLCIPIFHFGANEVCEARRHAL